MINQELRQELREIQAGLRAFFPPEMHEIRKIKGGGYWAYLKHQSIRDRLDEVCPEWEVSYSSIELVGTDVSVRCSITILGVTKQSIGAVPMVAAVNKTGEDVSIGSASDRVRAEAFKNACEEWGIGRYLDDQAAVFQYLSDNKNLLSGKTLNEVADLKRYLQSKGILSDRADVSYPLKTEAPKTTNDNVVTPAQGSKLYAIAKSKGLTDDQIAETCKKFGAKNTKFVPKDRYQEFLSYLESLPGGEPNSKPVTTKKPSEAQLSRMWAIASERNIHKDTVRQLIKNIAGVESGNDIPLHRYDEIIRAIEQAAPTVTQPQPDISQPQIDRNLLLQEITSLRKRRNLTVERVREITFDLFGISDSSQATDSQLLQIRDYLASSPVPATV